MNTVTNSAGRYAAILLMLCITSLLGGCAAKQAEVMLPEDIPVSWGTEKQEVPPTSIRILELVGDERVTALVRDALANNPDIGASEDRLMAQAALLGVSRSQLWPALNLGVTSSRMKSAYAGGTSSTNSSHQTNIGLSWELDVWGKIRDKYEGERAALQISRHDYEAARDSLAARTVQAWVRAVSLANSIRIADDRISNLEMIQKRVLSRYRDGLGSIDELSTANTRIFSAKAARTDTVEVYAQSVRELEILLGRYPGNLLMPGTGYPQLEVPTLFQPGEVLAGRPDVQKAMEQVRASALKLSAAEKQYLPSFVLTGKLFSEKTSFSDLLSGAILWDMILSASQPVFDSGRIKSEVEAGKWEQKASVKELRSVVLKATGEVRQYWGVEQMLGKKEELLQAAGTEAGRSYDYFEKRYLEGLDPISNMLNAKEEQISIQSQINELQAARLSNRIDLALALGLGEHDE